MKTTLSRILVPVAVLALLGFVGFKLFSKDDVKHATAIFPNAISMYVGSDVRVMGVAIGEVTKVTPEAEGVRVEMKYDASVEIPIDTDAVIINPSIVGDRFVQFTKRYVDGPTLPDNATLDLSRTAVPLELDEVYQGIDDLTVALGPQGANKTGALSDLLDSAAKNWGGQGEQFHQTIVDIGRLTGTLDNNKEELFGSLAELEGFIGTLSKNDETVRAFNQSLSQVSELLAGERDELSASLHNLAIALNHVQSFVKENKDSLGRNIKGLNKVVQILVKQRVALDEILRVAPVALGNLSLTYNPQAGTLDTRSNMNELPSEIASHPATLLCTAVLQAPGGEAACEAIKAALPRSGDFAGHRVQRTNVDRFDPTLGGLVEVSR